VMDLLDLHRFVGSTHQRSCHGNIVRMELAGWYFQLRGTIDILPACGSVIAAWNCYCE
jgi:hypothetical protein